MNQIINRPTSELGCVLPCSLRSMNSRHHNRYDVTIGNIYHGPVFLFDKKYKISDGNTIKTTGGIIQNKAVVISFETLSFPNSIEGTEAIKIIK